MRSVQHFCDSALWRTADARQNALKYAIEIFDVTPRKQILAKKPGDFQAFTVFGNLACELKTRGPRGAHAQTRGKLRQRNFRHGMVLQSKAHFENRIVSCFRLLTECPHQLNEGDGVAKRINR